MPDDLTRLLCDPMRLTPWLNAAIRFENSDTHVEYVRIDNATDGIRPVGGPFTVRGAWLTYVRDDCVENEPVQERLVTASAACVRPSSDRLRVCVPIVARYS